MDDLRRGPVVKVQFQMGDKRADWNCELVHPNSGKPLNNLPDRALDDAIFHANEFRDTRPLDELREYRAIRSQMILGHFANCARQLIDKIEIEEGWDEWMPRLKRNTAKEPKS